MSAAFIIGLPVALRRRLEAEAQRNELRIKATLADVDRNNNTLKLLPYPGQALSDLQAFYDAEDWVKITVVVLPYAPISPQVIDELEVLISGGSKVVGLPTSEAEGFWPPLTGAIDSDFNDLLYAKLAEILFPSRTLIPSEHFLRLSRRNPRLILASGSLDQCDEVYPERHSFLISVANAFEKIVKKLDLGESFAAFFKARQIDYAPTGGMWTELTVKSGRKQIYKDKHQIHVKYGEGMAPQLCPRIYFHHFQINTERSLVVMYVGPHPKDSDEIERTIHM